MQFRERMLIGGTELSSLEVAKSENPRIMNVAGLIGWLNLAKLRVCLTEQNKASIYFLHACCGMRW